MANSSTANRWWENYLVRYLMPSIAGMVIVMWLAGVENNGLREFLLLPTSADGLNAASLTLLFLYGNLFCYIASYPILCFHATRVLDVPLEGWRFARLLNSYVWTAVLAILVLAVSLCMNGSLRFNAAIGVVVAFSAFQIVRIWLGLHRAVRLRGVERSVDLMFGYAYALSRVRGVPEDQDTFGLIVSPVPALNDPNINEELTRRSIIRWRNELVVTYRHLREHGNSAFIFVLELVLCGLVYSAIAVGGESTHYILSKTAVLLFIWATPAVLVHLVGQHMEREFSLFNLIAAKTNGR